MADTTFSKLSDDIILQIFFQLEDDPRNWARLSCVCTKFYSLITSICCKSKCITSFHTMPADLLSLSSSCGGWASLYKIAVSCPGLLHAGILLDNSDFGLQRELGPTEDYLGSQTETLTLTHHEINLNPSPTPASTSTEQVEENSHEFGGWSLYDDLYFDTIYDNSETGLPIEITTGSTNLEPKYEQHNNNKGIVNETKRRKVVARMQRSHLASGAWNLSREQGNKLLGSRFRDDCLYISEWPGCVHLEEKRNYRLFRGIFKNFKKSRVWRTINDGNRCKIELNCAFCSCKETWDLHSAFCLKRGFGFHDDGEPVVRAYVCENGHVSGAWTDLPLYT
ncbi:unnamed protein product [Amaranthus hypochondriacus]